MNVISINVRQIMFVLLAFDNPIIAKLYLLAFARDTVAFYYQWKVLGAFFSKN